MGKDITRLPEKFISDIRGFLSQARAGAYAAVNAAMVTSYWQIGRRIVEEEQQGKDRAEYGSYLIKELAKQLSGEFGKGFSVANLKNFRQFYMTFPDLEKSYTLCSQLSWSHLRLIMREKMKRLSVTPFSKIANSFSLQNTAWYCPPKKNSRQNWNGKDECWKNQIMELIDSFL